MRLIAPFLAALALAMPLRAETYQLPPVVSLAFAGQNILLVHEHGKLTYLGLEDIVIISPELNQWGWPNLGYANGTDNPHVLTTTYESIYGEHTITTPCQGMTNQLCVARHAQMIKEMQAVLTRL